MGRRTRGRLAATTGGASTRLGRSLGRWRNRFSRGCRQGCGFRPAAATTSTGTAAPRALGPAAFRTSGTSGVGSGCAAAVGGGEIQIVLGNTRQARLGAMGKISVNVAPVFLHTLLPGNNLPEASRSALRVSVAGSMRLTFIAVARQVRVWHQCIKPLGLRPSDRGTFPDTMRGRHRESIENSR
jgi:hypothetical protein